MVKPRGGNARVNEEVCVDRRSPNAPKHSLSPHAMPNICALPCPLWERIVSPCETKLSIWAHLLRVATLAEAEEGFNC